MKEGVTFEWENANQNYLKICRKVTFLLEFKTTNKIRSYSSGIGKCTQLPTLNLASGVKQSIRGAFNESVQ